MPELPEVHALVADLETRMKGRRIERVAVLAFHALKTFDPPVSALHGHTIEGVTRHGKFLDLQAGELHLVMHLSRAGWIRWRDEAPRGMPSRKSPIAARIMLEGGSGIDITEAGTRKALALHVVADAAEVPGVAALGPDALELDDTSFAAILRNAGKARIKKLLTTQSALAGIGNAYSDEILHAARMSPFHPAAMDDQEITRLYQAMRETLSRAVQRSAGQPASQLKSEKKTGLRVHGRYGEPCPVCADTIKQVVYSDSSFQYCPTCQNGGQAFSDRGIDRLL